MVQLGLGTAMLHRVQELRIDSCQPRQRSCIQAIILSLCGPALWIFVSSVSPSQVHAQQSSPAVVTIAYPNNGCQSRRKKE